MIIGHFLNAYKAGGTDKVVVYKIKNWTNKNDKHILLCNSEFEKKSLLKKSLKNHAKIIFYDSNFLANLTHMSELKLQKLLYGLFYYPLFCYLLMPFEIKTIYNLFKPLKIDAIIINNGGWPAARVTRSAFFAAKLAKINKILYIIHSLAKRKNPLIKVQEQLLEYLMKYCKANIITVSNFAKKEIIKNTLFSQPLVIYNGISYEKIDLNKKNYMQKKLNLSKKNFIVSILGTIDDNRGQEIVIESISRLKYLIPNIILVIVGNGEKYYVKKILESIKQQKLKSNVKIIEYTEDAQSIISLSDIIINPVKKIESFGLVSVEAMALKKPVISTYVGAVPEVIKNRVNGLLVKKVNSDTIADKILLLFKNKILKNKLGKTGYKVYINNFTARKMSYKYRELIKSTKLNAK